MTDPAALGPFTYHINRDRGLVLLTYLRQPEIEEWRDIMDRVMAEPRFRPGLHVVSDRRLVRVPPGEALLTSMAEYMGQHTKFFGGCRWGIAMNPECPADPSYMRFGERLLASKSIELRAFTDIDRAVAWATLGEGWYVPGTPAWA